MHYTTVIMITVSIHNLGKYPISAKAIREKVQKTLIDNGISSDCETAVAIVSREKMKEYVDEYYKDGEDHPVLSFPTTETEGPFTFPPDGILHIGEIIISYPWAKDEANKTGKLVEDIVLELAEHACLHLVGIHHD